MTDQDQVKIYFDYAIEILEKVNKTENFGPHTIDTETVVEVAKMIQAEKHHAEDTIRKL